MMAAPLRAWRRLSLFFGLLFLGGACEGGERIEAEARSLLGRAATTTAAAAGDEQAMACARRIAATRARPGLPGAGAYEAERVAFLGRAAGAPVIFVEPPPAPEVALEPGVDPLIRLERVLGRYPRPARRARLLRGGYLFSDDPAEAFVLVDRLRLADLFEEPQIWLQRGAELHRLERVRWHEPPHFSYRHTGGPFDGQQAVLLFADRVAVARDELGRPLHRDVRSLREKLGFDRLRVLHRTETALTAELRFGEPWVEALIDADGAHLRLACLAASGAQRAAIAAWLDKTKARRRAIAALRLAIDALVVERLPFDRPHDAEDHLSDGRLRPNWEQAYGRRRPGFGFGERGYPVFDREGRPHPPETCVAMVLDAYERAAGTWYRPLGEPPGRVVGALDFDSSGAVNRSGVLGFERFARDHPELFEHRRFSEAERIPFADRARFFGYLVEHAEDFAPGDVVAIQGIKRDGNIHQHAILIEDLDPLTGFASGLVDQMTRPRRRTWEDIMAEAPARSLLFHLRPTAALLALLAPERVR